MDFGFIIPTCCKKEIHIKQLLRCVSSIRVHYPTHKIILINDYDDTINSRINDENIEIIKSVVQGSADQQIFKVFLESDMDKMVFIQDSMMLNKKLSGIESINDIQFLWHFTNHQTQWDNIQEPTSEYNINNGITTHSDLITHILNTDYQSLSPEFYNYAIDSMKNKNKWCGGFGCCCIMTRECLEKINRIVPFIDLFMGYNSNRLRRVNESIFALLCHYVYPNINFKNSYDGLYYDGKTTNRHSGTKAGFDGIRWCHRGNYVSKISFNR